MDQLKRLTHINSKLEKKRINTNIEKAKGRAAKTAINASLRKVKMEKFEKAAINAEIKKEKNKKKNITKRNKKYTHTL